VVLDRTPSGIARSRVIRGEHDAVTEDEDTMTPKQSRSAVIVRTESRCSSGPAAKGSSLVLYFERTEFDRWKGMAGYAAPAVETVDVEPLAAYVDRRDPQRWPADSGSSIYATPADGPCGRLVDLLA
jgi:hypothetical protein